MLTEDLATRRKYTNGFTIVELLIVIVVIGILAAITIVAFNGISGRAKVAALTSDLKSAVTKLESDKATSGAYPATAAAADGGQGLKVSPGNSFTYYNEYRGQANSYCLVGTIAGNTQKYTVSSAAGIKEGQCEFISVTKGGSRSGCGSNCYFVAINTTNLTAGSYSVTCVIDGDESITQTYSLPSNGFAQFTCWTNATGRPVYVKLANWGQSPLFTW